MKLFVSFVLLLTAYTNLSAQPQMNPEIFEGPGGMRASCTEIDDFQNGKMDAQDTAFNVKKFDWTEDMVSFIASKINQCYNQLRAEQLNVIYSREDQGISMTNDASDLIVKVSGTQLHAQQKINDIYYENHKRFQANKYKQFEELDGMRASCAEIDDFANGQMDAQDTAFNIKKFEWTGDMISFISSKINQCYEQLKYDFGNHLNHSVLEKITGTQKNALQRVNDIFYENHRRVQVEKDRQEEEKRQEIAHTGEAKVMAQKKLQEKISACQSTKRYQLYDAQESVIGDLDNRAGWERSVTKERKISRASDVRNLTAEYNNGAWLVEINENLKNDWEKYKALGGTAKSPRKVTHLLTDPC